MTTTQDEPVTHPAGSVAPHHNAPLVDHVIVCGLRDVGLRIVEQLLDSGEEVAVLGEFVGPEQRQLLAAWNITSIPNAGNPTQTLTAAGIAHARAIVCVTGNNLRDLEIALLARELRSDVRVVAQLSNQAVGRAMSVGNWPGAVLDIADLAAPSIVEACLSRHLHQIDVGGTTFVAATVPVTDRGSLRHLFGDLAPVAVIRPPRLGLPAQVIACPGRDFKVTDGDRVTMIGTPEEFEVSQVNVADSSGHEVEPAHRRRWRNLLQSAVWTARDFDPGLYRAIIALVVLVLVSTVVLWRGYSNPAMSMLDALYFSTETIATVGYGDFNFSTQAPWLRMWAIFLMIGGITTTAVLMAYLTEMLISRRLGHAGGRRRARTMTGHVVVVGLGAFGIRVAAELQAAGKEVVVVERNENNRFLAEAAALSLPVIFGDSTLPATLEAARVWQASAVAVMTSDDMVNIETGIAIRDMLGDRWSSGVEVPVVMRVFDKSLGLTVSHRFGFRNVQSTEEITAPWFVGAALGLDVLGTFPVEHQAFMVGRLTVEPGGGLAGVAMNELSANTRVIALTRHATGAMEHPPRRGTRFEAGDLAYLVGPYEELLGVLRRARVG